MPNIIDPTIIITHSADTIYTPIVCAQSTRCPIGSPITAWHNERVVHVRAIQQTWFVCEHIKHIKLNIKYAKINSVGP